MNTLFYRIVAALDFMVIALFYGPNLTGISLRWIPQFEEMLPTIALLLLGVSSGLVLMLISREVRARVLRTRDAKVFVPVIAIYTVIAGLGFAILFTGGA